MKKFLCKAMLYLIAILSTGAIFVLYTQSLPAQFQGSLMGITATKMECARKIEAPKILLVGGSSTVYSTSSTELSKAMDMPCMNMGTTAYVGLPFVLNQAKVVAKKGDIIIVAPEIAMYEENYSYKTILMALENHKEVWKVVPISYYGGIFLRYGSYANEKIITYHEENRAGDTEDLFAGIGLNATGDYVIPCENILENGYKLEDMRVIDETSIKKETVQELNRFYEWSKDNGITVYLTYAPFNALAVQTTSEDEAVDAGAKRVQALLDETCDMPQLLPFQECIMDESLFFNSNNHLNTKGAQIHTAKIIEALQEAEKASKNG